MKRGVALDAIHFFSFPYTSERAKEKVIDLARILCSYQGGMRVHVVSFTEIQMQIHEKCPEAYGTLITRRFMMRIANEIAHQHPARRRWSPARAWGRWPARPWRRWAAPTR